MPPKNSKKKADPVPNTPKADSGDEGLAPATPPTVSKPKTPRKPKAPAKVFSQLATPVGGTTPVTVAFDNDAGLSQVTPKDGFGLMVKLNAPQQFELVGSYLLEDGLQAIIIKPSPPFPFEKLPNSVRLIVMREVLTPTSNKAARLDFTSDKQGNVQAKDFSKEFKHRLAIVLLNKKICAESYAILYSFKLKFDNTTTMLNFMTLASDEVCKVISRITITSYIKATAMSAMTMLSDCRNLEKVNILSGVGVNSTPAKAAKAFFADAGRLLQALVQYNGGNKDAALSIVVFGKGCLTVKEDDELVVWDEELQQEFTDLITMKLNESDVPMWSCICGEASKFGHECRKVLAKREAGREQAGREEARREEARREEVEREEAEQEEAAQELDQEADSHPDPDSMTLCQPTPLPHKRLAVVAGMF